MKKITLLLSMLLAVFLMACTKNVTVEPNLQVVEEQPLQENDEDKVSCDNDIDDINGELEEWVGEYTFQESISEPFMFMDYKIDVYEADDGKYYANIIINGQQTAAAIQASINGNKDKIEFTFLKYLPEHMSGGYVEEIQGDVLLKLWKDTERMYTDWGKINPMLEENSESGKEYFIRVLNDPPKMVHRSTKLYPLPANQRALLL